MTFTSQFHPKNDDDQNKTHLLKINLKNVYKMKYYLNQRIIKLIYFETNKICLHRLKLLAKQLISCS